jgi:hypothetical protein
MSSSPTKPFSPKGELETLGGVGYFGNSMKSPKSPKQTIRTIGALEGEQGGIFHYISRLEKEASMEIAAAVAGTSSSSSSAANSSQMTATSPSILNQEYQQRVGELGQQGGLGAFLNIGIADTSTSSLSPSSSSSSSSSPSITKRKGSSRKALVPSHHLGVFESSSTSPPGQGLAAFMSDYEGEKRDFQKRIHVSVLKRRESALASLGVRHPGEMGALPEDPSLLDHVRSHHEKDIELQRNSVEFTEEQEEGAKEVNDGGRGGGGGGGEEEKIKSSSKHNNDNTHALRNKGGRTPINSSSSREVSSRGTNNHLAVSLDNVTLNDSTREEPASTAKVTPHNGGALSEAGGLGVFVGSPGSTHAKVTARHDSAQIENAKKNVNDKVGLLLVSDAERLRLEDEAITREIEALDNARKERESGGKDGKGKDGVKAETSPYASASALLAAQEATRRALFGTIDAIGLGRVTPGKSSRIAARAAAQGLVKVPIENARLVAVRKALRDRLPKDPRAAALALKHKLAALDGDRDGVLGDEELLGALMDLAPSTLTASDLGHAARLIKSKEAASRLHAPLEAIDAIETESVPILPPGEEDFDSDISALNDGIRWGKGGVSSDSVSAWILGLSGGMEPLLSSGWNPITRSYMGVGTNDSEDDNNSINKDKKEKNANNNDDEGNDEATEKDEKAESSSRFDFSSKGGAYTVWRASWEDKHGAPARKERELDALVPPEGNTWTRADPQPFRVLRLIEGATPSSSSSSSISSSTINTRQR